MEHRLKGIVVFKLLSKETRVPSPRSVVTLSYKGLIQYVVVVVAGVFPSLGKDRGYQGILCLNRLLDRSETFV